MSGVSMIKKMSHTLSGNILLFEVFASTPLAIMNVAFDLVNDEFTWQHAVQILLTCIIFGVVMGIFFWFSIIRFLVQKSGFKEGTRKKQQQSKTQSK